jgi:GNAT superfamily N-acetyltransferase
LRFANGYTKRANSINPTYPELDGHHERKITTCEAVYGSRGLPTIFRLTSFGAPQGLDDRLIAKGYRHADQTLVLARSLAGALPAQRAELVADELGLDPWLDAYTTLSGAPLERREAHLAILRAIPGAARFCALRDLQHGSIVAAGLAVVEHDLVGLFDIVTGEQWRNRGYGAALVAELLRWGAERGAETSYLQVIAGNAPAVALYRKLGYADAYSYWYRIRDR